MGAARAAPPRRAPTCCSTSDGPTSCAGKRDARPGSTALERGGRRGRRGGPTGRRRACGSPSELAQLQLYAVLSPLEKLFDAPERRVKIAVLEAMQTLFFKRSFVDRARRPARPRRRPSSTQAVQGRRGALLPARVRPARRASCASRRNPDARAAALRALARIDTIEAAELLLGVLEHGVPRGARRRRGRPEARRPARSSDSSRASSSLTAGKGAQSTGRPPRHPIVPRPRLARAREREPPSREAAKRGRGVGDESSRPFTLFSENPLSWRLRRLGGSPLRAQGAGPGRGSGDGVGRDVVRDRVGAPELDAGRAVLRLDNLELDAAVLLPRRLVVARVDAGRTRRSPCCAAATCRRRAR